MLQQFCRLLVQADLGAITTGVEGLLVQLPLAAALAAKIQLLQTRRKLGNWAT
jgi:hypothetical protein